MIRASCEAQRWWKVSSRLCLLGMGRGDTISSLDFICSGIFTVAVGKESFLIALCRFYI